MSGSPAWAGIDLLALALLFGLCGLPRVGGDRPVVAARRFLGLEAPPRGRG